MARLGDRLEPMHVQAFVSQRPVKRLYEGIVGGLAWSGEVDPHAVVIGPEIDKMAGELSTIISKQILRGASLSNQAVENFHHVLAAKPLSHLDCQCFTTKYVDYGQCPELLTMAELVVDEVKAPGFIQVFRTESRRRPNNRGSFARSWSSRRSAASARMGQLIDIDPAPIESPC